MYLLVVFNQEKTDIITDLFLLGTALVLGWGGLGG